LIGFSAHSKDKELSFCGARRIFLKLQARLIDAIAVEVTNNKWKLGAIEKK